MKKQKGLFLLLLLLALAPCPAAAQLGGGAGLTIQLTGIVQVEPGDNVLTLNVKDTEIRFQAQAISSAVRDLTLQQFLSDLRHRSLNLEIKGPELLLDLLLKEKPSRRVLKLSGLYYSESRRFLLHDINTMQEIRKPQF
jgi:hypothetical protein